MPSPTKPTATRPQQRGTSQGRAVTDGSDRAMPRALPKLAPSPMFVWAAHPASWVCRDGLIVPAMRVVQHLVGVNNVREINGRAVAQGAIQAAEQAGWQVIKHAWGPSGHYVEAHDCDRGVAHVSCFDVVRVGSDKTKFDTKAFHAWAWKLVDEGKIDAPWPSALRELAIDYESLVRSYNQHHDRPHVKSRVATLEKNIEILRKKADELDNGADDVVSGRAAATED